MGHGVFTRFLLGPTYTPSANSPKDMLNVNKSTIMYCFTELVERLEAKAPVGENKGSLECCRLYDGQIHFRKRRKIAK